MVFLEGALGDFPRPHARGALHRSERVERLALRPRPRHVAGHELDACVLEVLSAHVLQGDPADDVERVARFRRDGVVVGLPPHPSRQVGELHVVPAGRLRPEAPQERRFQKRLRVERVEDRLSREAELDLSVHLHDRLPARLRLAVDHLPRGILRPESLERGGVRHVAAAQDLPLDDLLLPGLRHGDLEIEHLPLGLAQQKPLAQRIALVVLLEDPDGVGVLQVAQHHGIGLEVGGDVGDPHLALPAAELQGAGFLHGGEVLVVDRQLRLGEDWGGGKKRCQGEHSLHVGLLMEKRVTA